MLQQYEDTCRSLGVIQSSGERPSKRKMGAVLPPSQDATATKRKRTIGPQVGPSLPEKPAKDREVKLHAIGPSLGPLRQVESKERSFGPTRSAIGPEGPTSKPQGGGDTSLKLKANQDAESEHRVDGQKATKDRCDRKE